MKPRYNYVLKNKKNNTYFVKADKPWLCLGKWSESFASATILTDFETILNLKNDLQENNEDKYDLKIEHFSY